MITGTTKSGFDYSIGDEALDDYELLEDLSDIDQGDIFKITIVARRILGEEQLQALKEHIRNEKGRVSAEKMGDEINQILNVKTVKNS